VVDLCIQERIEQLSRFLCERGAPRVSFEVSDLPRCPLELAGEGEHTTWVKALPAEAVRDGVGWLVAVVERFRAQGQASIRGS
jgi:hypothetical protein